MKLPPVHHLRLMRAAVRLERLENGQVSPSHAALFEEVEELLQMLIDDGCNPIAECVCPAQAAAGSDNIPDECPQHGKRNAAFFISMVGSILRPATPKESREIERRTGGPMPHQTR